MLFLMRPSTKAALLDWVNAGALWLALAWSLGWYYTFTYYGRSGWPMPTPEACGGLILYYFSVLNGPTEIQALHWMLVFPLAGILWVGLLSLTAPYFGRRNSSFPWSLLRFALASLPLSLPGPYMAYVAGASHGPWNVHAMVAVALRRGGVTPWGWLSPLYLTLGMLALGCHVWVYRQVFEMAGRSAWKHFLLTAVLFVLVMAGLGTVVTVPLRFYVEGQPLMPGL